MSYLSKGHSKDFGFWWKITLKAKGIMFSNGVKVKTMR